MKDEKMRKYLQKTVAVRQIKRQAEQRAKTQSAHAAEATESTQESVNDYGSQKIEQAPEDAAYAAARAYTVTRKQAQFRREYLSGNGAEDNHNKYYVNSKEHNKPGASASGFQKYEAKSKAEPRQTARHTYRRVDAGNSSTHRGTRRLSSPGDGAPHSKGMSKTTTGNLPAPTQRPAHRSEPLKAAAQKQAAVKQIAMGRRQTVSRAFEQSVFRRAKSVAASTGRYLKMMLQESQMVTSLLSAGGIVAMLVVVLIVSIGMIVGSSFGILFSGEDTGTGMTIRDAIREINLEYETKLLALRTDEHDSIEMTGSRAVWKDVLSVYAVRETTDPDHPQEVVSVTDEKKRILRDLFWEMNVIEARVETVTKTVTADHPDTHGHIVTEQHEVTEKVLYIDVRHKSAEEMAHKYHFNADQNAQLTELLSPDYNDMWASALYGITSGDTAIVDVARSQLGNIGGQPYWSWYGFGSRVEWCACFVSWCANECGYIENGIVPKYAYCPTGADWFKDRGQWAERDITPEPGMIIFFDWARGGRQDGETDHTGIVEKVENGRVYTIEGNSGNACRERSYPLGWYEIYGYGILN